MTRLKALAATYHVRLLVAFLAFAIVPLLALGVLTYGLARLALEESAVARAVDDMRRLSEGIDALVAQHASALEILCADEDIRTFLQKGDSQDYYRSNFKLMLAVGGNGNNAAAHVVSARSAIGATTRAVPGEYFYPYNSGWGVFRKAERSEQAVLHVNDSQVAAETGANISFAKAIRSDRDDLLGFAVIDVKRQALSMLLPEKSDEITYIVNWNSYVVYCSRGGAYEGLNRAPAPVRTEVERLKNRAADSYTRQGGEHTILVSLLQPASGFTIVSEISRATIVGNIRVIRNAIITISALMLLLCPLVAAMAAKNVSAPIRKLTALMKKVEKGDFSVRTGFTRSDEIGVLGQAFDHMTMRINQLVDRVAREQKSLRLAQLQALQAQINPHFIYNTLDLIKYKAMLGEVDDVSAITVQLGRMLRYLANVREDLVAVSFELDFISQYIDIQKRRYDQRINVRMDIDAGIMDVKIPKLILQPAVENAFVHGLENRLEGGRLTVTGGTDGDYIVFTIADNGAGIDKERLEELRREHASGGSRIGLSNVGARARLYGDERCGVELLSDVGVGTTIVITILPREKGLSYD